MTDEHGSLNLSSCILSGIIGLGYGLIDYYVTVCIMVNWVSYLEPGPPLPDCNQIACCSHETFDGHVVITGNGLLSSSAFYCLDWKPHNQQSGAYNKSGAWIQSGMMRQHFVCWHRKPERFQNIMINNSFGEWNYCSACSFLVNWILEEKRSQNLFKVEYLPWVCRAVMIFIMFTSLWYEGEMLCNAAECSSTVVHLEIAILMGQAVDLAGKLDLCSRCNISIKQACPYV